MSGGGAWTGAAVAAVTAGYALVSRRLSRTVVTASLAFTACGVLIGPAGLDILDLERDRGPVLTLVEAALTVVLFTDAMAVRGRDLHRGGFLPLRLLVIALPLTIAAEWLLGRSLLPGLAGWQLALIAVILAPTDVAVSRTAMTNRRVPALVRHGLNVEAGLNDGLVLPLFLLILAALPGTEASEEGVTGILWRSLVLSTLLGLAVGGGGGRLLHLSRAAGWITREWSQVMPLAVAGAAYTLAHLTGGSGFIAAWAAGFAFAYFMRRGAADEKAEDEPPLDFAENVAGLLTALSFLVFGAVLLGPALQHLDWRIITYALLSVTVLRLVVVALALAGSGLRMPTVAYVGWFGPRGLASLVLGLLVVEEHVPGAQLMGRVVACTVALSILLHGMSAVWLSERYGDWYERAATERPGLREGRPDSEVRAGPPEGSGGRAADGEERPGD
ncbi:cation:proton antiporter [Streptomyces sp. NPDC051219]|uniref:cation:proton antiporter domain-containing protein n=1 Tax=Streptomyces sp. NPDC051219 TaxID=3155283 RepID=UPI003440656C